MPPGMFMWLLPDRGEGSLTCSGLCVRAQVVMVLKKEVMKTQSKELEKGAEYRHLLVHAIHECAAGFPDVAASVIHLLMDFLGDANSASALDVIFFVREIMARAPTAFICLGHLQDLKRQV